MQNSNIITFGEKTYFLDNNGFLYPSEQWDENFANGMAKKLGIYEGLSNEHWNFIQYLRKKFLEEKTVPLVVYACADNDIRLNEFRRLFPNGYHRGACRIAGINYKFMYESNPWLTYETTTILREEFKLTAAGFLEEFEQWNENFAQIIVREWKLSGGLTARHWEIIRFLRDEYHKHKNLPTIFETCKANNLSLEDLRDLFPAGYRRGACRIAGLPFFS